MYIFIFITLFLRYFSESYEAKMNEKAVYEFESKVVSNPKMSPKIAINFSYTSAAGFAADKINEILSYFLIFLLILNVTFIPILAF